MQDVSGVLMFKCLRFSKYIKEVDCKSCAYYINKTHRCSYGFRNQHMHKNENRWVKE